jgi:hypothetical protein
MEPTKRLELIDSLLAEASQKFEALEHAAAARGVAQDASHSPTPGTPTVQEQYRVQDERDAWEKVYQGLTEVRSVLQQIGESERQRGVSS